MSYSVSNPPVKMSSSVSGPTWWHYSSADPVSTIYGADYFSNGDGLGMGIGDMLIATESDNSYRLTHLTVTAVTSNGAATVSAVATPSVFRDAREYGIVADDSTDNADALDAVALAGVQVIFPIGTVRTSRTWYITNGFTGRGKDDIGTRGSSIKATETWLGGDYLIDVRDLDKRNADFKDIELNGNVKMKYVFGASDLDHSEGGTAGFHRWDRVAFFGATEYLFYFPDAVSSSGMETVGGLLTQCFFNANHNAGLIYLGIASDDMTFINTRLEHFNSPGFFPVRIHAVDVSFINTFYTVGSDMDAGIDSLFLITSGGQARVFDGLFVEPSSITFTNWKYVFRSTGSFNSSITNVHLEGSGPTLPSDAAFVRAEVGWSSGRLEVRNVSNGLSTHGMTKLFGIANSSTQSGTKIQEFIFSGVNGFATLTSQIGSEATTAPRIHLVGSHGGVAYSHKWESNGTTEWLVEQPSVGKVNNQTDSYTLVSGDAFKHIRMDKGTANTLTVPPAAATVTFPAGTEVYVFCKGAGTCTLTPGAGVTLNGTAALAQNESATLILSDTANEWDVLRG